mmetsp:Transcript_42647/g.56315  ORF Transcript_42647/g.56315 Transcript_42647/m.56315 type:complete len:219 (+) Transcript_42647:634-1290(+)
MQHVAVVEGVRAVGVCLLLGVACLVGLVEATTLVGHIRTVAAISDKSTTLAWLHHRQNLRETLTVARDSLRRLPEGQAFPDVVVNWLSQQIHDILLTAGAVGWTDVFLGEHSGLFLWALVLKPEDHIVQLFDGFLKSDKLLFEGFLVGNHVLELVDQVLQALHHARFQLSELVSRGGVGELLAELVVLASVLTLVVVQVFAELGDRFLHIVEQVSSHG